MVAEIIGEKPCGKDASETVLLLKHPVSGKLYSETDIARAAYEGRNAEAIEENNIEWLEGNFG